MLGVYVAPPTQSRVYDCGMAEWHPDIPTKVREECRKRNAERLKKEQNETNPRRVGQ